MDERWKRVILTWISVIAISLKPGYLTRWYHDWVYVAMLLAGVLPELKKNFRVSREVDRECIGMAIVTGVLVAYYLMQALLQTKAYFG